VVLVARAALAAADVAGAVLAAAKAARAPMAPAAVRPHSPASRARVPPGRRSNSRNANRAMTGHDILPGREA
jgi:hypothetical protein